MANTKLKRRWALVLAIAVLGTTVAIVWATRSGTAARSLRVARLFGGDKGLEILSHPDRIEAFRLEPIDEPTDVLPVNYPVMTGPVTVPGELSIALTSALASEESYDWDKPRDCMPSYGLRLSFYRGRDRVDVLLCMNCETLLVIRNGEECGMGQFNPIRAIMVDAVKSLFPNDQVIQSLSSVTKKYVHGL